MNLCLNVIRICMDVGELVGVYVGKSWLVWVPSYSLLY